MSKIYYEFTKHEYSTGGSDPEDRWSRDSTSTTWYPPSKAYLTKRDGWGFNSDDLPWEVIPGDVVYCVWVQYSTGDSFGHDDGRYHEVIGWYKDAATASKAVDAIYKDSREHPEYRFGTSNPNVCMVPTFDGQGERPISTGTWKGYFESLDRVEVDGLTVF